MARTAARKWSQQVTEHSDALDLKQGIFKEKDPKKIARSLKDSAEHSERRKSDPYRSAMSMLTFYINRAGAQLQPGDRLRLEKAKDELRTLYHRPLSSSTSARRREAKKPGDRKAGGPSRQREAAKHDRTHANK